ncbi:MAG: gliding motility-associated C-terminal domain-containing protein [Taibaiella sp.]|nr:gliding motility-associated C-terminal domain-containing protein [Taibaiella sp.]
MLSLNVPANFVANSTSYTGDGYIGLETDRIQKHDTADHQYYYAEYIEGNLNDSLQAGYIYKVYFYAEYTNYRNTNLFGTASTKNLGLYFSDTMVADTSRFYLSFTPSISDTSKFISGGWTKIQGRYKATGHEKWVVIGNFFDSGKLRLNPVIHGDSLGWYQSYYFIDNVNVSLVDTENIDTIICLSNLTYPIILSADTPGWKNKWSTGDTTFSISVTDTGVYTCVLTGNPNIFSPVDVIIKRFKIQYFSRPYLGPDTAYCFGDPIILASNKAYPRYKWNTGDTTSSIKIHYPGNTYILDGYNGCHNYDTVNINFYPPTPLPVVSDTSTCANHPITILPCSCVHPIWYIDTTQTGGAFPTQFLKIGGHKTIYVTQTLFNCESNKVPVNIEITPLPSFHIGNDTTLCNFSSLIIGDPNNNLIYKWNTGDTGCCIPIKGFGTYVLQGTNRCGSSYDSITINEGKCDKCVWVPDAFTPNGDGRNDVLHAKTICSLRSFHMQVFDRWGDIVFISDNINYGWDGIYLGKPAAEGAYYYIIEVYKDAGSSKKQVVKGDVILIR